MQKPRLKKFNLKLYEIELIELYRLLKNNKPHMVRVETELKKLIDENQDFRPWDDIIEIIERKKQ